MSPLDPRTLGTGTPTTLDGRTYPDHLRAFEVLDPQILPFVADHAPVTFDELSVLVTDPEARAMLPRWIASATWRGLLERRNESSRGPWTYVLGPQGNAQFPHAA